MSRGAKPSLLGLRGMHWCVNSELTSQRAVTDSAADIIFVCLTCEEQRNSGPGKHREKHALLRIFEVGDDTSASSLSPAVSLSSLNLRESGGWTRGYLGMANDRRLVAMDGRLEGIETRLSSVEDRIVRLEELLETSVGLLRGLVSRVEGSSGRSGIDDLRALVIDSD